MAANQFGGPGGTIGSVYTGQQGVDRAVVLGEADDSLAAFTSLIDDQQKLKAEEKKAAVEAKKEADKKRPGTESWWIQHDAEMTGKANELMTFGGQLMAAGVDPLNGTTPEALRYRTELDLFDQDAKMSQQVKDMYVKEKAVIDADKEGKYTQESKDNLLAWFSQYSLKEIKEKGLLPPNLEIARPEFNRTKFLGEFAAQIATTDPEPSEERLQGHISQAVADPSKREYVLTLKADLANIKQQSPEMFSEIETKAKEAGVSQEEVLGKMQLENYYDKKPFDLKAIVLPKPNVEKGKYEYELGKTTWKNVKDVPPERWTETAKANLALQPKLLDFLKETTKDAPEGERVKDYDGAVKWLERYMKTQVEIEIDRGSQLDEIQGIEGTGYTTQEIKKDHDIWRKALVGKLGKTAEEQKIAKEQSQGYIIGTKTEDGSTIIEAYTPGQSETFSFGSGWLGGFDVTLFNPEQKEKINSSKGEVLVVKAKKDPGTLKSETQFGVTTSKTDEYEYIVYDLSNNPVDDPENGIRSFPSSSSNRYYMSALKGVQGKRRFQEVLGEGFNYGDGNVFQQKNTGNTNTGNTNTEDTKKKKF